MGTAAVGRLEIPRGQQQDRSGSTLRQAQASSEI